MTRRRMYAFERAYTTYAGRLLQTGDRLRAASVSIWNWFWSGPGSATIEGLLPCALFTSPLVTFLLVGYQLDQGHGLSRNLVVFLVVNVLFGMVLLWAWTAAVGFVARLLSGTLASGCLVVLGVLAAALVSGVFGAYLLILVLLTALSLLVFVPLRVGQEMWVLYRHIAYLCPHEQCSSRGGLPIHVCACGEKYSDLVPNFYGVFYHTCRHDGEDKRLWTLDLLGRNKLSRLCNGCERPLVHSSLGELAEWPVALVGGTSSGKTVLLVQAASEICRHYGSFPKSTAQVDSDEQRREIRRLQEQMARGLAPPKTTVASTLGLAIRVPKRLRCLLYVYDAPGEDFARVERFGEKQNTEYLRGAILLVDPFTLPVLVPHGRSVRSQVIPSSDPFVDVASTLLQGVRLAKQGRSDRRYTARLAVVLTKADALPVEVFPFLRDLCPGHDRPNPNLHTRCRDALVRLGAKNSLDALEQAFDSVGYFACSGLGRNRVPLMDAPFRPQGVAEPFLWLLEGSLRH